MSEGDTRRAEEIFLAIADLPRELWDKELAARCNGDTTLTGEVRSLLDCHAEAGEFLDARELHAASLSLSAFHDDEIDDLKPGVRFGEFLIERPLGRGGMGRVFVATQDRPKRSVALKVIRRGLATPGLLRRFEHEAEVLGRLHHPGIAQIYEAGAARTHGPDGAARSHEIPRPYIAMELVNGPPLNVYAETRKLGTRDRLELMAKVCDAVHHAHQRGVIHRDLKPANILIDEHGQPKVLDFGVARAADADLRVTTLQTNVGQLIGTLPYMSPEQVLADPSEVDTRSDVYALGVNLYEVLTGRLPLDLKSRSIPEAARVIKEEAPAKLSHVSRVFRGEIDTIVSKAMDKDKTRRYQSAGDLAEDIRRHLRGEPIHARQDSALYVIRTQLRRYRWAVAVACFFLLGLAGFSLYAGWSARTERRLAVSAQLARRDAEREKANVDLLNARLEDELAQANIERGRLEGAMGNVPLAEDILWGEHLKSPGSAASNWGLWELYRRFPILWTVPGERALSSAAVSADGASIAIATRAGSITFYRGATGLPFRTVERLGGAVSMLAFTPDGSGLIAALETGPVVEVPLLSTEAPRPVVSPTPAAGEVRSLAVSPDGSLLAIGTASKAVALWDLRVRRLVNSWTADSDMITALAFSQDGSRLASGSRQTSTPHDVTVWSVPDGSKQLDLERDRGGYTLGLMFAGRFLLSASNEGSSAWYDLDSGEAVPLRGEYAYGGSATATLSPAGDSVFVGGLDRLYGLGDPAPSRQVGGSRYRTLASGWLNENVVLVVGGDGSIRAVDVRKDFGSRRISGFRTWCHSVAFSPDGATIAVGGGDGTLAICDALTLERRATVELPSPSFRTRSLVFFKDSKKFLAAGMDGAVRVIDTNSGKVLDEFLKQRSEVFSVSLDPSERLAAVGHADGVIRVWNLATGSLVVELPRMSVRAVCVAFSPDGGSLVSPYADRAGAVWDTKTWSLRQRIETTSTPWSMTFRPDGRTLLVTTGGGTVEVFDWPSLTRRAVLLGHQRLVPTVAFSPDGRYFATGSEHGTAKLWDAATLRTLANFEPEAIQVTCVQFDPSSRFLAVAAAARFTVIYDLHAADRCIEGNEDFQARRFSRIGRAARGTGAD